MSSAAEFSQTYYDKADEETAFADYAPFRYGQVERDPAYLDRSQDLRPELDPILVGLEERRVEKE